MTSYHIPLRPPNSLKQVRELPTGTTKHNYGLSITIDFIQRFMIYREMRINLLDESQKKPFFLDSNHSFFFFFFPVIIQKDMAITK